MAWQVGQLASARYGDNTGVTGRLVDGGSGALDMEVAGATLPFTIDADGTLAARWQAAVELVVVEEPRPARPDRVGAVVVAQHVATEGPQVWVSDGVGRFRVVTGRVRATADWDQMFAVTVHFEGVESW